MKRVKARDMIKERRSRREPSKRGKGMIEEPAKANKRTGNHSDENRQEWKTKCNIQRGVLQDGKRTP